jgi:hypothetical protein
MLNTRLMSDECRPHKLRPTGLGSGIDKDRPDYAVYCGDWDVGRIYQTRSVQMNADQYLFSILQREQVDTVPNSSALIG